ncbi:hypothetical protein ACFYO2_45375 [Streptomyces sp. NPDC006602]|uniref:hypothetical protein n=1 Tax=Streptomyces sp. NPDC006602 TaxID=3364751 RepID=UPI0036C53C5E
MTEVSRASLQTDLANALERNNRLAARVRQLEKRLSQSFGAKVSVAFCGSTAGVKLG